MFWNGAQCSTNPGPCSSSCTSVDLGPTVQLQSQGQCQVSFWTGSDMGETERQGRSMKTLQLKVVRWHSCGKGGSGEAKAGGQQGAPPPPLPLTCCRDLEVRKCPGERASDLRGQLGRAGVKVDLGPSLGELTPPQDTQKGPFSG